MKYRIGIDLGGTNIKLGIVDPQNRIFAGNSAPTRVQRPYQEIVKSMAELVLETLAANNIPLEQCQMLGIGSPGTIQSREGIVVYSNNFSWENVPLREEIQRYLQLPVYINNDANCAALGEAVAGAGKGRKNVVLLTLGTGVGSGIILEGKIFEGGYPGGAEFGHHVICMDGEPCTCGRKGCFEAYASATALIRETRRAAERQKDSLIYHFCKDDLNSINGSTVFLAAEKGDQTARQVVENYIRYLSEGIANIINLLRPDVVLLSGGVCNQGDVLTMPINQKLKELCFGKEDVYIAPVIRATLSNDAGIIGAANLS